MTDASDARSPRAPRWAEPEWQAAYDRLRAKIIAWQLDRAFVLEPEGAGHRLTFAGWWQVRRAGPEAPLQWWRKDREAGQWCLCPEGPAGGWPNVPLLNGGSAKRPKQDGGFEWQGNSRLALWRLVGSDAFVRTQPPFNNIDWEAWEAGIPQRLPNPRMHKGPGWRLWHLLELAITPKTKPAKSAVAGASPSAKPRRRLSGSQRYQQRLRQAQPPAPPMSLWFTLRKHWWTHFIDRTVMGWAARIYWQHKVFLHDYAQVERHRTTVSAFMAKTPQQAVVLSQLPPTQWAQWDAPDAQARAFPFVSAEHRPWLSAQRPSVVHAVRQLMLFEWAQMAQVGHKTFNRPPALDEVVVALRAYGQGLRPKEVTTLLHRVWCHQHGLSQQAFARVWEHALRVVQGLRQQPQTSDWWHPRSPRCRDAERAMDRLMQHWHAHPELEAPADAHWSRLLPEVHPWHAQWAAVGVAQALEETLRAKPESATPAPPRRMRL